MPSQSTGSRTLALGALFLVALCVLGYYTLFLTNISWFKPTYDLQIHFQDLNGLREGDSVLVAGMRWGRIKSMEFDPEAPVDKRITVIATLEKPLPLRDRRTNTVLQELKAGEKVHILREDGDWVLIVKGGDASLVTGWAKRSELLLR